MDPTKLLEADHRQAEAVLDKIKRARGAARTPLIDELATALRGHLELEEEVLHPAMVAVTGAEAVEEANTEHQLARNALDQMRELAPDKPGFGAALEMVKAGIQHHVKEEEGEVFPKLRRDGESVLDEVSTPMMHKRIGLGLPVDALALAKASTKDELLTEAKNAGIETSSSMSKEKLAKALAEHRKGFVT